MFETFEWAKLSKIIVGTIWKAANNIYEQHSFFTQRADPVNLDWNATYRFINFYGAPYRFSVNKWLNNEISWYSLKPYHLSVKCEYRT